MKFWIECIPPKSTGQAGLRILRRKNGSQFIGKYSTSKSMAAKNCLRSLLEPFKPDTPLDGAVQVSIKYVYPWRKNEPKKNKVNGIKYCTTKPDVDNCCKLLLDQLTQLGYWVDDSLISILHFEKYWGDNPGIEIEINPLIN